VWCQDRVAARIGWNRRRTREKSPCHQASGLTRNRERRAPPQDCRKWDKDGRRQNSGSVLFSSAAPPARRSPQPPPGLQESREELRPYGRRLSQTPPLAEVARGALESCRRS